MLETLRNEIFGLVAGEMLIPETEDTLMIKDDDTGDAVR